MSRVENMLSKLGERSLSTFRIVREIRFYQIPAASAGKYAVDLVVETDDSVPNYRLKITFINVSGFRHGELGGGETRIIGLEIVDIADRGWEQARFELIDYEHDQIHLYCRDVDVTDLAAASLISPP